MKTSESMSMAVSTVKLRRQTRNFFCFFFFALLVLAGQAEAVVSISGTISNSTGKSGRLYITANANGNYYGTSIASAGAYTIQGVPPGQYTVKAFLDSQNISRQVQTSPTGSYSPLLVGVTNVTGLDITLTEPAPIAPPAPRNVRVYPGDSSALIRWDGNRSNDIDASDTYDVYWSTSASVGKAAFEGSRIGIPAGNDAPAILTGLSNSASYYFVVIPKSGGVEGMPSTVFGPVIIGAATGAHTVSGTVTFSGTPTGPLYVAVVNNSSKGKVFYTSFANPVFPQNFSIAGVPDGVYSVYPILDNNNDKLINIGDIKTTDDFAPSITLNGSGASGVIAPLVSANAVASVRTEHTNYGADWYNISFNTSGQLKQPVGVTLLSGPNVSGPIDLGLSEGGFHGWIGESTRPAVGSSYIFQVKYADNSTENLSAAISAVLDSFPANPQVFSSETPTPVFTWEAPTTTPPANFHYQLWLNAINENSSFWETRLPASQLSATFNYDGGAEKPLVPGSSYNWSIAVRDAYGNKAVKSASFTNGIASSGGISGKITNQAGVGISGISISVNTATGSYIGYSGVTQVDGTYSINGVPTGNYSLLINGNNGYISQWYNNVVVLTGTTTANINATLNLGGSITGKVTNSSGTGIAGITVNIMDATGNASGIVTTTRTDGTYTVGVPNGSWKVLFSDKSAQNSDQWYNNKSSASTADLLTVATGVTLTNIDAVLSAGNKIVVASSSGSGTLVCSGTAGGAAFNGDCSASFDSGTTITAQATPSTGYLFAGWGGACSGSGTCTVLSGSAPVYAGFIDTKTIGGVPNEGNLSITLENDGKIGVKRFNAGSWQDQVYNWNSKGSLIYFGGISYGFGYFTGNASFPPIPDLTATSRVSDSLYKNVWRTLDNMTLIQTVHYQPGAPYYSLQWDIVNNGTTTFNDLRFFHAQDTYFYGTDNGAGFWDASNTTVGVEKHVTDSSASSTTTILKRMSLQAVTPPYAYDSKYYYDVAMNVVTYALTNTLNTNETTDNGYALEWRSASLAPGATWSIVANEKFADVQVVGGVSVKAPVATNCIPGNACTLNFTLTNSGVSQTVNLTSSTDQTGWSSSLASSSLVMAPGSIQQIPVTVVIPGSTASGIAGHVTLTANTASDTASVNAVAPLQIVTTTLPNSKVNQTGYSQTIASAGGVGIVTFSYTGTIPSGMTLSAAGVLSGTPTAVGTYSFTLKATDSVGTATTKNFSITITPEDLVITTAAIPNAVYGKTFSQQLTATGGTAPYSWSTTLGSILPPGLYLSSSGVVSGIPTTPGSYSFEVNVADTAATVTRKTVTIIVDKATLTVTPTSASRVFGVANPALTTTFSGFVNNDASESVTGAALLTTTATSDSPAGSYPITATAGSLASSKYVFVFANGTFTITKATPVITWANPAAITFGTALSATQLNATTTVPGTFTYVPAAGVILNPGTQVLSVTFTPTDSANYNSQTSQATVIVNTPPPVVVSGSVAQIATGSDGALVTSLEMTSPTSKTVIATGTKMSAAAGGVIIGTLNITANAITSSTSLPPAAAAASTSDGKKLTGVGGAIDIVITNGSATVKTITPAMTVNLAVDPAFAAPGTVVQYYSFDGAVWTLEGTTTVKTNGTVDLQIGHLSIWGVAKFEAPTPPPSGDINGDGTVDITDALKALQFSVGMFTPSTAELAAGDVAPLASKKPAPNGVIDVGDAVVILQKAVGLVSW